LSIVQPGIANIAQMSYRQTDHVTLDVTCTNLQDQRVKGQGRSVT